MKIPALFLVLIFLVHSIAGQYINKRFIHINVVVGFDDRDILFNIDTKSIIDDKELRSDCKDLKFMKYGTTQALPHYVEKGCGTTNTSVWIRFENLNYTDTRIEMFSNNPFYYLDENQNRVDCSSSNFYFFFQDSASSSCSTPSTYFPSADTYFIRHTNDKEKILDIGGSETHTHEFDGILVEDGSVEYVDDEQDFNPNVYPASSHQHTLSVISDEAENIPEFYTLRLCSVPISNFRTQDDPIMIPNNVVIMTDQLDLVPTGLEGLDELNNNSYYIRCGNTIGEIGGEKRHFHTIQDAISSPADKNETAKGGSLIEHLSIEHTHAVEGNQSDYSSNEPFAFSVIFMETTKDFTDILPGMILLTDHPSDLLGFSALSQDSFFLRAGRVYGDLTGENGHTHSTILSSVTSSVPIDTSIYTLTGANINEVSSLDHTHEMTGSCLESILEPPFQNFQILKRLEGTGIIEYHEGDENIEILWHCEEIQRNQTGVCNNQGVCYGPELCLCHSNSGFLGINCDENVGREARWNEDGKILIPYSVNVGRVEDKKFEGKSMDNRFPCSWMISITQQNNNNNNNLELSLDDSFECGWETESLMQTSNLVIYNIHFDEFYGEELDEIEEGRYEYNIIVKSLTKSEDTISVNVVYEIEDESNSDLYYLFFLLFFLLLLAIPLILFPCCTCCVCLCYFCFCFGCVLDFLSCCCCFLCCQQGKLTKLHQLEDVDLILLEQQHEKDTSIAHLRIDKKLFEIPFSDLKIGSKLGEGGSNSIIFKAEWNGRTIAFKCFRASDICREQEQFQEFEREVGIMASISHPNILSFYGATIHPPRIGIIIEYCENKDTKAYIESIKEEDGEDDTKKEVFAKKEKLRLLIEVAGGMSYLHANNVIHRDLKWENVLLSRTFEAKIMDFGLSKVIHNITSGQTKRVGTSFYMAPEVAKGDTYDGKCDTYSFGIMIHEMILENFDPYDYVSSSKYNIEFKVASNPDFRPKIDEKTEFYSGVEFLIPIAKKCWSHEPDERPTFDELIDLLSEKNQLVSPSVPSRSYKKRGNLILLEKVQQENEQLLKERDVLDKETGQWQKVFEKYNKEYKNLNPRSTGTGQKMLNRISRRVLFRKSMRKPPPPPPSKNGRGDGKKIEEEEEEDLPEELFL